MLRDCAEPEFVAIALYTKGEGLNDEDIWYVCKYHGSTIENWTNMTQEIPTRIFETLPFQNTSIGLVNFHTTVPAEARSLACQFTLHTASVKE